nr:histidine kinase [Embleya scabrispora]
MTTTSEVAFLGHAPAWVRNLPDRTLVRIACALAGIAVACCAAVPPTHAWVSARADVTPLYWSDLVLGAVWPVLGAFVVRGRPRNPVGWLLVAPVTIGPYLLLALYGAASALGAVDPLPGARAAAWVGSWGFCLYFFVVPLLLLLFPDGRLPSTRWRPIAYTLVTIATVTMLAAMVRPGRLDVSDHVDNPLGIPGGEWIRYVVLVGAFTTLLPGTVVGACAVLVRSRRVVGVRRTQLQWLLLGSVVLAAGLCLAPLTVHDSVLSDVVMGVALSAPALGIAIAMLRHRMFDVEFVLNRTIVYVVLSALTAGLYAAIVLGIGSVAPGSPTGVLAVAVLALVAASGRGAVQAAVDHWLFGHRHDPYAVVARVGRHVAPASEPAEALQRLVDALARALRLPYVAFHGDVSASAGAPVAGWRTVPAYALGQRLGELRVGLRRPDERWTPEEQSAVEEVAARAATLAYAAGLVADVADSRARIVTAREEERRRIRADLHDGVGPVLAGTAHQLDALARRLAARGDEDLAERARAVRDRLRQAVADVRNVVHGLRPPILDQLGLAGALRDLVAGYETPHCAASIGSGLEGLPAAVEVAAYAIAAEAISNAIRHSAAGELRLGAGIRPDGTLVVEIRDNGCGVPARPHAGVGLRSMGERAVEVGGRLDIRPAKGGGTIVRAELPA